MKQNSSGTFTISMLGDFDGSQLHRVSSLGRAYTRYVHSLSFYDQYITSDRTSAVELCLKASDDVG
jgi:hypothetical protein